MAGWIVLRNLKNANKTAPTLELDGVFDELLRQMTGDRSTEEKKDVALQVNRS